jgi:hypothetical protein
MKLNDFENILSSEKIGHHGADAGLRQSADMWLEKIPSHSVQIVKKKEDKQTRIPGYLLEPFHITDNQKH